MSQVHKMAGSSWHIEEHYDTKSYARNCVNCVCFQKEGRMCRKKNEHVSFNFARYCKHFENKNKTATNTPTINEDYNFEESVVKEEPILSIFLIRPLKRWKKPYIQKKSLLHIYCGNINDKKKLKAMTETTLIICYDGFASYKIEVRFFKIENNQLYFTVQKIYNYYILGFLELSNSKTKTVVEDINYQSVLFVQERLES